MFEARTADRGPLAPGPAAVVEGVLLEAPRLGPVDPGEHEVLIAVARVELTGAWADYYEERYSWTIVKAWTAAGKATLSYPPGRVAPIGLRALSSGCPLLEEAASDASLLDSLYHVASDAWLLIAAGGHAEPRRVDALRSIEAAVRIIDHASTCGPGDPRLPAPPVPSRGLRIGDVLILVDDTLEGVPLGERLFQARDLLAPGLHTVILTRAEAEKYVKAPWARYLAMLGDYEVYGGDPQAQALAARLAPYSP